MRGPPAQPPRPNDCTYWVTDRLLAGEYPAARGGDEEATRRKIGAYLDRGVSVFLDLTHPGEKEDYEELLREAASDRGLDPSSDVSYVRLPVRDFGVPEKGRMTEILDAIDRGGEDGRTVYVHCRGGIGRTGTVVGCFLARHGNSGDEALEEVNRLFQSSDRSNESYYSPETTEQMNFVRRWTE